MQTTSTCEWPMVFALDKFEFYFAFELLKKKKRNDWLPLQLLERIQKMLARKEAGRGKVRVQLARCDDKGCASLFRFWSSKVDGSYYKAHRSGSVCKDSRYHGACSTTIYVS